MLRAPEWRWILTQCRSAILEDVRDLILVVVGQAEDVLVHPRRQQTLLVTVTDGLLDRVRHLQTAGLRKPETDRHLIVLDFRADVGAIRDLGEKFFHNRNT